MNRQMPLSLTYRPAYGRRDFLVGACNHEAVEWIDRYPNWPMPALLIYGAAGCGKSHLASIFSQTQLSARSLTLSKALSEKALKTVVEDVDCLASEEALFYLYNALTERGGVLLMTARTIPVFKLKDLRSRITAMPKVFISPPDDELLGAVLTKVFYEKQLNVNPDVVEYTVNRLPRSFEAVLWLADTVDKLSFVKRQKVTVPLMREALKQYEETQSKIQKQLSFFDWF